MSGVFIVAAGGEDQTLEMCSIDETMLGDRRTCTPAITNISIVSSVSCIKSYSNPQRVQSFVVDVSNLVYILVKLFGIAPL